MKLHSDQMPNIDSHVVTAVRTKRKRLADDVDCVKLLCASTFFPNCDMQLPPNLAIDQIICRQFCSAEEYRFGRDCSKTGEESIPPHDFH
jgi:hypothetical protein